MTRQDVKATTELVKRIWTRLKWSEEEWSVFQERCARMDIEATQAEAALRELVATSDKYPKVAILLDALKRAENRPHVGRADPLPTGPSRLGRMRDQLARKDRLPEDQTPTGIVLHYWLEACWRSMKMTGDVPQSYRTDFIADAAEVAHMGTAVAEMYWDEMVSKVAHVEPDPALMAFAERVGRVTAESCERWLGKDWKAKYASKRKQVERRVELHKVTQQQESAA